MDDTHDFYRESKRQCTQHVTYNHNHGTTTTSSYISSSWGAQNGVLDGHVNTLHQLSPATNLSGHVDPQHAAELLVGSHWPDIRPGYFTHETLGEVEAYNPGFGIRMESFVNENPYNIATQTDSELNIEYYLNDTIQEGAVMEVSNTTAIDEYVHEASNAPSLRDNHPDMPLQFTGDYPPNLGGDAISQDIWESISRPSITIASEPDSTEINLENTYPGPACVPTGSDMDRYDACFGVIVADALSSFTGDQDSYSAPVKISPCKEVLKLYFQDSNKYAGLLVLPALCELFDKFSVRFSATLVTSPPKSRPTTVRNTKNRFSSQECSVRIVIYGLKSERSDVGNLLSKESLYLQHPSATECDRDVIYCNPHYLVRPGCQLPVLAELSISSNTRTIKAPGTLDEVEISRLLRVFDSGDNFGITSQISASPRLRSTLKDHQLTALSMMTEKEYGIVENATFPSIWELNSQTGAANKYRHRITGQYERTPRPLRGGILADEMGLGKTLSVLALICSTLDEQENRAHSGMSSATLVVTPKSTIPNWTRQIDSHIHPNNLRVAVYLGSDRSSFILNNNDLILTTYETLRSDWSNKGPLYSAKWYRLVLDEAHHIRNRCSQAFKAACAVLSHCRWCLTGTPIQNSLDDYGALLSFLAIPPFENKSKFDFWIATPLENQKADGLRRLKDLIRATCLRRTKRTLGDLCKLPRRTERIESIEFHKTDLDLYAFFKEKCAKMAEDISTTKQSFQEVGKPEHGNILSLINFLRLICDHGLQLLPQPALDAWKARNGTSINWQMMQNCRRRCCICETDIEEAEFVASNGNEPRCRHWICTICALQSESTSREEGLCPKCATSPNSGGDSSFLSPPETGLSPSAKIEALLRNLHTEQGVETTQRPPEPVKSVVFSCWIKMLDLIQQALQEHGFRFKRIDGKTSLENRSEALRLFNDDPRYTIMLASIGSAGEGVDLTVANHVHLIEPQWNPMVEAQAVDRVHRIGQKREVVITRYIMLNSIERYIQRIQDEKLQFINQSIDSEHSSQDDIENRQYEKLKLFLKE